MFTKIQLAYEVLSNEQERAWYDSHKESILKGYDLQETSERSSNHFTSTSVTPINCILRYFNPSIFRGYGNDIDGFYRFVCTNPIFVSSYEFVECLEIYFPN
jgi:DnaJ homolog subfamily A member 5